jgi:outer membrane protein assembly factor BamB
MGAPIISTPVLISVPGKDLLAVPLKDGSLKALDPENLHDPVWVFNTKYQDPFVASPAVFDFNRDGGDDIVITSKNGYLYIINGKRGSNLMEPFFTGNSVSSSPVLADINNDGFLDVVFGSENHNVYAFTIKTVPDKIIKQNRIVYGTFLNRKNETF